MPDLFRWSRRMRRTGEPGRSTASLLVALTLSAATLITVDSLGGADSPLDPVRTVVGEALSPAEQAVSAVVRPIAALPEWARTQRSLERQLARTRAENARLREQVATAGFRRNRLAQFERLTAAADHLGYAMVPARVIGYGPAQSFGQTVLVDAGSRAGVHPDQTVVNDDGLVGRVIRVTRSSATVLLVVDPDSIVGGRIGESMELGFLHGRGTTDGADRLDLELVDDSVVPARGDTVVTWGSESGAPYVPGIPVGRVTKVYSSLRETAQRAVIEPFVDFSTLDVVGVVVPSGTRSDRGVIEADGRIR